MKFSRFSLLLAGLLSLSASAFEPFPVKDIRVEGVQRTEPGTVFSYLGVKVGEVFTDEKASAAVKALFATGFFRDVRLEVDRNVLVVYLQERPAVSTVEFIGQKEFDKDKLKDALKQTGLSEGRIFDRNLLDKAEQELKNQYLSRGKYGVGIATTVTPLERNRVALTFNITEGEAAKIFKINFVGNKVFKESELVDLFVLRTPGWLTWYSRNDQYSKQKLEADLESLRSFYLNQGYLEFAVESTQVSISPDKKNIFLTVNVNEGKRFTVSEIRFGGELILPEAEMRKALKLKKGDVFSREKMTESTKTIVDRLGNDGYAFANVNPVPETDPATGQVAFTLYVDAGRRVYVRRVNISGNANTRDEVIRRELRQLEGSWYSTDQLKRSKQRVDKLGYFSEVNIDTVNVAGVPDQVDVEVKVVERPTGQLLLGVGFSTAEKVILSGSISQNNLFGTGNALSLQVNSGSINRVYAISYNSPYVTDDGVSTGYDFYKRNVDATGLSVSQYKTATLGTGIRFGVPVTEFDTVNYGLAVESTNVETFSTSPQQYIDFVNTFGPRNSALITTAGYTHDLRDSVIYTTRGSLQRINLEAAVPPAKLQYYRSTYQVQWWLPVAREDTLQLSALLGYADGYGAKPLPFYKNYYLGGVGTVRGFETSSIGPKDTQGNALGGRTELVANAEFFFPFPGLEKDKSVRLSAFLDAGSVGDTFTFVDARYASGLALSWYSPVGPIKISLGFALNPKPEDKLQKFQFSLGTVF